MARELKNKVIVIIGGANGIGFTIADKYLSEGAKIVILLDIDKDQGKQSVQALNKIHGEGKAIFMVCDVTSDLGTVGNNILTTYETIDVLVNSAGIADDSNPKRMIDINTTAVVEWTLKFYEHMRTDRKGIGGTVINISSILGFRICALAPMYTTTKFAVTAFTRALGHRDNYNKTGVRIIAICPGFTETKMTEALLDKDNKRELPNELLMFARNLPWQKVNVVGDAAVEVFKRADSGTAWLIEGGKPIEEVL